VDHSSNSAPIVQFASGDGSPLVSGAGLPDLRVNEVMYTGMPATCPVCVIISGEYPLAQFQKALIVSTGSPRLPTLY
jgi:hypothetical protein